MVYLKFIISLQKILLSIFGFGTNFQGRDKFSECVVPGAKISVPCSTSRKHLNACNQTVNAKCGSTSRDKRINGDKKMEQNDAHTIYSVVSDNRITMIIDVLLHWCV